MFNDLIIYSADINALITELKERGFVDESDDVFFPVNPRTPIQHINESPASATLVRIRKKDTEAMELLSSFNHLEILGTKEEVEDDPAKTEKYLQCYSREPYTITDSETGETVTVTPPHWHGEFA